MTWKVANDRDGFAMPAMLALLLVMAFAVTGIVVTARRAFDSVNALESRVRDTYLAEAGIAEGADAIAAAIDAHAPPPETITTNLGERSASVEISAEAMRIDLNLASSKAISEALVREGAAPLEAQEFAAAILRRRQTEPIRSMNDVAAAVQESTFDETCLAQGFTLHGSAATPQADAQPIADFGSAWRIRSRARPAAGELGATITAVVRLTGDAQTPLLVHEWRRSVEPEGPAESPCSVGRPS